MLKYRYLAQKLVIESYFSITQTPSVNRSGKVVSDGDPKKLNIFNTSSMSDDGNAIGKTQDNDLDTRWSAKGNERNSYFSIVVSENGSDFTTILAKEISGGNRLSLEEFVILRLTRYVCLIDHGNSSNTWNSLTEVEVWGTEL